MAVLTIAPIYWYAEPLPGSQPWSPTPPAGTNHLKLVDGETLGWDHTASGTPLSSQFIQASSWVDLATGFPVDWSDKLITNLAVYVEAGLVVGGVKTTYVLARASNPGGDNYLMHNQAPIDYAASPNVLLGSGAVNPPPTNLTPWDSVRNWILANDFLSSLQVITPTTGQSFFLYGQNRVEVTYNNIAPPPAAKTNLIMEF